MIIIQERIPKKIPGITSLFVEFPYNEELIDIIKQCVPINYDKKTHLWEMPLTRLSKFVNLASKIDNIELNLLADTCEEPIEPKLQINHKTSLYKYQEDAVKYGLKKDSWLLLDAPGLGKTLTMISLAEELKYKEKLEHCLIICGINTLKTNWKKEIAKHSNLSSMIVGEKISSKGKISYGSMNYRVNQLKNPIKEFFVILNIETLRSDDVIKALLKGPNKFDMIVLDEAHVCKSNTSTQGRNLLKLTKAKHRIALTGTLLLNNPLDCYVPLKWTGNDNSTFSNFKCQYYNYGGLFGNELIGYKNIESLKAQLESCSLRRTKDLLDLPEKTIINEYLDMTEPQALFYNNVLNGVKDQVDKVKLSTANLLALTTRLRQSTSCPSILTTDNIPSAKIDRCCELIHEIVSNGNKVVVFSIFKETLNEIYKKIETYNPLICTGDIPDSIISSNIDDFQTDTEHKVMLCTHSKMGTGVTLTAASYAIFIDMAWTAGMMEQCEDRIHRIGSKNPVFIYRLHCNNTVDLRVKEIVDNKEAIGDYIVDNIQTDKVISILSKFIQDLQTA